MFYVCLCGFLQLFPVQGIFLKNTLSESKSYPFLSFARFLDNFVRGNVELNKLFTW